MPYAFEGNMPLYDKLRNRFGFPGMPQVGPYMGGMGMANPLIGQYHPMAGSNPMGGRRKFGMGNIRQY